jgi:hypothetical protein
LSLKTNLTVTGLALASCPAQEHLTLNEPIDEKEVVNNHVERVEVQPDQFCHSTFPTSNRKPCERERQDGTKTANAVAAVAAAVAAAAAVSAVAAAAVAAVAAAEAAAAIVAAVAVAEVAAVVAVAVSAAAVIVAPLPHRLAGPTGAGPKAQVS